MTSTPDQPGIQWDDSAVANLHLPNFCNVASSPRDVTLLFGMTDPQPTESGEVTVQLRNRIVLRPVAAKLLGTLLQNTLAEYEARHGAIDTGFHALPGSRQLAPTVTSKPLPLNDLPEKAALLLDLVKGLGVDFDVERSCKIMEGAVLPNRVLLGFPKAALPPQGHVRLPILCKRLGMPAEYADAFQRDFATADIIHFGFEEGPAGSVYKAYAEFAAPTAEALAGAPEGAGSHLLYLGYKWNPADSSQRAISRYTSHPLLTAEAIDARMARLLGEVQPGGALEICRTMLDVALSRADPRQLLFVEVTEDGNPRASFDLNLYPADLRLAELYPVLLAICRRYALPLDVLLRFYGGVKDQIFGHVSAGIDREGRDFLTVYFGGRAPRQ
jgi:tryptophan halogenase